MPSVLTKACPSLGRQAVQRLSMRSSTNARINNEVEWYSQILSGALTARHARQWVGRSVSEYGQRSLMLEADPRPAVTLIASGTERVVYMIMRFFLSVRACEYVNIWSSFISQMIIPPINFKREGAYCISKPTKILRR